MIARAAQAMPPTQDVCATAVLRRRALGEPDRRGGGANSNNRILETTLIGHPCMVHRDKDTWKLFTGEPPGHGTHVKLRDDQPAPLHLFTSRIHEQDTLL